MANDAVPNEAETLTGIPPSSSYGPQALELAEAAVKATAKSIATAIRALRPKGGE